MPSSTPHFALVSDELSLAVAAVLSIVIGVVPTLVSACHSSAGRWRPIAAGTVYAVGVLAVWTATRYGIEGSLPIEPGIVPIGAVFLATFLALCLNAVIPAYAYQRERLRVPLVWLFVSTTALLSAFLTVPNQSGAITYAIAPVPMTLVTEVDPLFVSVELIPVHIVGLIVAGLGERAIRASMDRFMLPV
ncbi:hypothetical protein [Halostagnicola kamekurae]|uniref:Uncharacterized protein n=1 Tax=Halostagnicola kamekurae TaxID=619731 RepID=A0A1I6UDM5_9EURY|nr:hypothetical protein [Halostagnicola kamekurae]SFS99530.1 hypothetical protein SAMN04488556_3778 [Halostagnicola kamekurae]